MYSKIIQKKITTALNKTLEDTTEVCDLLSIPEIASSLLLMGLTSDTIANSGMFCETTILSDTTSTVVFNGDVSTQVEFFATGEPIFTKSIYVLQPSVSMLVILKIR